MRLIALVLTLGLGFAPLTGEAQPAGKVYRIGYLHAQAGSPGGLEPLFTILREFGYVERENLRVERRYAEGRPDRLTSLARELVELKVDVIVSTGTHATVAARDATTAIPIVFMAQSQPVEMGLVRSLARPGGNLTGTAWEVGPEFQGKLIELFRRTRPRGLSARGDPES